MVVLSEGSIDCHIFFLYSAKMMRCVTIQTCVFSLSHVGYFLLGCVVYFAHMGETSNANDSKKLTVALTPIWLASDWLVGCHVALE